MVVPVHKRKSKTNPVQHRPISLLRVVDRVFARVAVETLIPHPDDKSLPSNHEFGFRSGRSTSDLLMLLSRDWQDPMDNGLNTLVVVLDIADTTFDRVWHAGSREMLRTLGTELFPREAVRDMRTVFSSQEQVGVPRPTPEDFHCHSLASVECLAQQLPQCEMCPPNT